MNTSTLTRAWVPLARAAGGVGALADIFGVSRMTVWNWAHGEREPSTERKQAISAWAKERGLSTPFTGYS